MMDSEKKAFVPLDDGALDEVTGGSGTVQEDGSVVYECQRLDPMTVKKCTGTVVFAPGSTLATCPQCGWRYIRDKKGAIRPVTGPARP